MFIDGCYWHSCPQHGTKAARNADYWSEKLAKNVARDADTNARLQAAGWTVVRFWEHEDPDRVAQAIRRSGEAVSRVTRRVARGRCLPAVGRSGQGGRGAGRTQRPPSRIGTGAAVGMTVRVRSTPKPRSR